MRKRLGRHMVGLMKKKLGNYFYVYQEIPGCAKGLDLKLYSKLELICYFEIKSSLKSQLGKDIL